MYILVDIIHTEFQYINLIEMQKYNWNRKRIEKKKTWKKRDLLSRLVTPTGTKGPLLSRLPDSGQKGTPFVPDWRSQLGHRDNRAFPTGTNQRFCSSGPNSKISPTSDKPIYQEDVQRKYASTTQMQNNWLILYSFTGDSWQVLIQLSNNPTLLITRLHSGVYT